MLENHAGASLKNNLDVLDEEVQGPAGSQSNEGGQEHTQSYPTLKSHSKYPESPTSASTFET